jgi:hypothetical protein
VQLGIVFWFYRDALVCENRIRMLRRKNPGLSLYGLYGGPLEEAGEYERCLGHLLDDFWVYPLRKERDWKWLNGDLLLARWFADRGTDLAWDSVFVAQWDLVVTVPLSQLLPPLESGEMLISGVRPISEVEPWWQWTQGDLRAGFEEFRAHLECRFGALENPMCCQFIALVAPRRFFASYAHIEKPELGFLEYKVPMYAQAFGVPLVPDTCLRPWWPEEPATAMAKRTEKLMHAWRTPVHLPVILYERSRPGGRRAFHPYHGIYPHDVASLAEAARRRGR